MKTELVTPEGQAWSDYIESKDCNPYAYETADHERYKVAMAELMEGKS